MTGRSWRLGAGRRAVLAAASVALTGCGGGDSPPPLPVVEQIAPALDVLRAGLGDDVELFQVAATLDSVELVVAAGGTAEGYTYRDGALGKPLVLGPAEGVTFRPDQVGFDPDRVLRRVGDDLDHPVIDRFEAIGGAGDAVAYSARVLSDAGGVLIVDLGPDGEVLGTAPG